MATTKPTNIVTLNVPARLHPLETAAQDFHRELLRLSQLSTSLEANAPAAVLLLQEESCANSSEAWLAELKDSLLLDELVERIHLLQRVCNSIQASNLIWMYAAAGSTFGGFFEIALACHKRFWFESTALVGFPEIESGGFPPGGSIEKLLVSRKMIATDWAREPYVGMQRALERDWADFVGDARDWQTYAESWLRNLLTHRTWNRPNPNQPAIEDKELGVANDAKSGWQTSDAWNADHGIGDKLFNAWDSCWKILSAKPRDRGRRDQDNLITYFSARHYLSVAYQVWVRRDSWHTVKEESITKAPLAPAARTIYVDLEESLVPPARPLARLLREGYIVVLVGTSARTMKANLELLFGRFERILTHAELNDLWSAGICWILADRGLHATKNRVAWTGDERLAIKLNGIASQASFIRLEGNKGSAASGWCEYVKFGGDKDAPPNEALALAATMSNGVIYTQPVGTAAIPVSLFVRSIFFEELLRTACRYSGTLNEMLDELRAAGWGFASSQSSWDYFLIHREGDFAMSAEALAIGKIGLEPFGWQIGHWKSASSYVTSHKKDPTRIHTHELSLHFAIFAGVVARLLVKHAHVRSAFDADTLVRGCIGFPTFHGTPLTLLDLRGDNRVVDHCRHYWPELIDECIF